MTHSTQLKFIETHFRNCRHKLTAFLASVSGTYVIQIWDRLPLVPDSGAD